MVAEGQMYCGSLETPAVDVSLGNAACQFHAPSAFRRNSCVSFEPPGGVDTAAVFSNIETTPPKSCEGFAKIRLSSTQSPPVDPMTSTVPLPTISRSLVKGAPISNVESATLSDVPNF